MGAGEARAAGRWWPSGGWATHGGRKAAAFAGWQGKRRVGCALARNRRNPQVVEEQLAEPEPCGSRDREAGRLDVDGGGELKAGRRPAGPESSGRPATKRQVDSDLGPSLREIWANRLDEKQKIKAVLEKVGSSMCPDHSDWFENSGQDESVVAKFLQAHPTDYVTKKLQETIRLIKRLFPITKKGQCRVKLKCYRNYQKVDYLSNANLYYKMVIHVHDDSAFRCYQQEMRKNQGLWPLYRGFFVDVNLIKANNKKADDLADEDSNLSPKDGLADEDSNLMVKLKFLTYKIRTFLIRDGLYTLFKGGPSAYEEYYLREMQKWGTSQSKQNELCKLLDKWADYIREKYGNEAPSPETYLSEAEPFLEQYAQRGEEDDIQPERGSAPSSHTASLDVVSKTEGLIVFFPGIPGCAKSALCNEILKMPGSLGDNRPLHRLEGDLTEGDYWQMVAHEHKDEPFRITLADKNTPNRKEWRKIEDMCRTTKVAAVPVIPDSEGTDTNPFSLEALAVFMFRVLKRVNHPGELDEKSLVAGCVLLMFYKRYDGKSRSEFESELYEHFGSLVKMPLLKPDRAPLPGDVKSILDEGLNLYQSRPPRIRGKLVSHTSEEWKQWEERLREILFANDDYLKSIQVPFDVSVKEVVEQLKAVAKGDPKTPSTAKRRFGGVIFAAATLSQADILGLVRKVAEDTDVNNFINGIKLEDNLHKVHITLAHKRSHGVAAVESYGVYQNQEIPLSFSAFLYNDKMAALEAQLGMVNGETVLSRNDWPHCTLWTAAGVAPIEANKLPQLVSEDKAKRVPIYPPITISGVLDLY